VPATHPAVCQRLVIGTTFTLLYSFLAS